MKVEKRTFIVSGGSSGLGLATVLELLDGGGYVSILDLQPPVPTSNPEVPSDLPEDRVKFIETDVTKLVELELAVDASAAWATENGAPLAGVVNCAGIGIPTRMLNKKMEPHSLNVWDKTIAVNLTGSFNLTRLVLRHLAKVAPDEKGERGVVIFVSSLAGFDGGTAQTAYAASKGGLVSMTLPMARDLGSIGVRVNTVAPGGFTTPLSSSMPAGFSVNLSRATIFPPRMGEPAEFAKTVRWLIDCGYINGETIKLWGGTRFSSSSRL